MYFLNSNAILYFPSFFPFSVFFSSIWYPFFLSSFVNPSGFIWLLLQADIVLEIPSIVMKPSLDDIQQALNKTVQIMLKTTQVDKETSVLKTMQLRK